MKFKILIPVYNDWQSVSELLNNIDQTLSGIDQEISVIIVNDASNHERKEEDKTFENIHSIKILNMKINQGHAIKAKVIVIIGARIKIILFELAGIIISLKIYFKASARD